MFDFPFWDFFVLIWALGPKARRFCNFDYQSCCRHSLWKVRFKLSLPPGWHIHLCTPKTMNFALENSRVEDERPKRCTRSWECRQTRLWKSLLKNPQVWKASGMRRSAAWQVGCSIHLAWMIPLIHRYGCALIRYWIEVYFLPWKSQTTKKPRKIG